MNGPGSDGERILVVDDDEQVRRLLERVLERAGYSTTSAGCAREARRRLEEEDFALVLSDMNMPGESGLRLIEDVLAHHPGTAAMMVSGDDDAALAEAALDLGAYGYILKPFRKSDVLISVANALRRRSLELENRHHHERLEQAVRQRTAQLEEAVASLERSRHELRVSREETIRRLSRAVEYRDEETGGHIERMSRYCGLLADRLGLDAEPIVIASPMHDVGKIAVPDSILRKPGPLTPDERREMQRHAEIGYRVLAGSREELLELAATIAWTHHEKFDGTGYPRGLAAAEIPLPGQIAAIADVFDALTTERVYRPAFPPEEALEVMRAERGKHFSPPLLDVFFENLDDVEEIRRLYSDRPRAAEAGSPERGSPEPSVAL